MKALINIGKFFGMTLWLPIFFFVLLLSSSWTAKIETPASQYFFVIPALDWFDLLYVCCMVFAFANSLWLYALKICCYNKINLVFCVCVESCEIVAQVLKSIGNFEPTTIATTKMCDKLMLFKRISTLIYTV